MGRRAKAVPSRLGHRHSHPRPVRTKKKGEYNGEDFDELVKQLKPLGLHVRKMEGDGNCLFRAFADQVGGDFEEHQKYRDECCTLMLENAEEFELFHADEDDQESESFRDYVQRMRHAGRWGSQLELMALCRRYSVNAIVHQSGLPAYEMDFAPREARCIQLSYHDGEHFNSIRFSWDLALGQPAQFLSLLQLRGSEPGDEAEESEEARQVRECLPPEHGACTAAIRAALVRAGGDASLAAEYLLTEEFGDGAAAAADASNPGPADTESNNCSNGRSIRIGSDGTASAAPLTSAAAAAEDLNSEKQGTSIPGGDAEVTSAIGRDPDSPEKTASGRPTTAGKSRKKSERRQAKEAADQRRRAARSSEEGPGTSDTNEKLSLLGKHLLSV